ncbi:hypothetical protein [Agromyces bauzanensis]
MEIEILHIEACPNWPEAGRLVSRALEELGAGDVPVRFTLITTPGDAASRPFAGSPTILVDGVDAFPTDAATGELACRVYRAEGRLSGTPSLPDLRAVLEERLAGS